MFSMSKNGIITLTRGDSALIPIFINAGDKTDPIRYELQDFDVLYFGVMEPNAPFQHSIIRKVLTKDDLNKKCDAVVKLGMNDTQYLQPGTYYYEVKLNKKTNGNLNDEGDVDTVVPRTKFILFE